MAKASGELARWIDAANALPNDDFNAGVPLHVFLGEAVDVAKFHAQYWEPEGKRPGLKSAVRANKKNPGVVRLTKDTGAEILSLQAAASEASTAYRLATGASGDDPLPRARFVADELRAVLEWLFDDGVEDDNDEKLASLVAAHASDPNTADALASELDDYAALARLHRDEIDGLGGFDAKLVDEARSLAAALRDKPATPSAMSDAQRKALALRNRVLALLAQRVALVRGAARFVFRADAALIRQATSAYERRRRNVSRKAKPPAPAPAPAAPKA